MVALGVGLYNFLDIEGGLGAIFFVLIGLLCFALGLRRYVVVKNALLAFDRQASGSTPLQGTSCTYMSAQQEYRIDMHGNIGKVRLRALSFVLAMSGVFLFLIGWFAYRAVRHGLDEYL